VHATCYYLDSGHEKKVGASACTLAKMKHGDIRIAQKKGKKKKKKKKKEDRNRQWLLLCAPIDMLSKAAPYSFVQVCTLTVTKEKGSVFDTRHDKGGAIAASCHCLMMCFQS
jgi:hypothetical protein